jgi:hypothetical protein
METLDVAMKKHTINYDSISSSSSSSSHGHGLSASGFSFNVTSTSSSNECIIDFGSSYHMAKDKSIFFTLNECNSKKIFVGDDRYLSVIGSVIFQVYNVHFNDVLCIPSLSWNLLSINISNHSFR